MRLRKTTVEEDEEFPVHRQNVVHTRVVRQNGLDVEDPMEAIEKGLDPDFELEVWYVENEKEMS